MDAAVSKLETSTLASQPRRKRGLPASPNLRSAHPPTTVRRCRASASTASSVDRGRDHYVTLGVPRDASLDDIKSAFRRLARQLHPDVAPSGPKKEGQFLVVLAAYQVLSDEKQRSEYDKELSRQLRPPPVYHDLVWEPVASAYKHTTQTTKRSRTHADTQGDPAPRESSWKTRMHFRKPFASRQQNPSRADRPYPRDWRESGAGDRYKSEHPTARTADEKSTAKRSDGRQSSRDVADVADDSWRTLWERSISSAVQYGEKRRSGEGRKEAMESYMKAVQAKLASCWPPTFSLVVDALFVWLSMVLWSLYGTQLTLAWLSVVMLTNPHGGIGHKFATGVAWTLGGEVGLCLVVALHATVWLAGHSNQYLAVVVACCLLVAQRLAIMYPKLGSSAVGLFVSKLWNLCT